MRIPSPIPTCYRCGDSLAAGFVFNCARCLFVLYMGALRRAVLGQQSQRSSYEGEAG